MPIKFTHMADSEILKEFNCEIKDGQNSGGFFGQNETKPLNFNRISRHRRIHTIAPVYQNKILDDQNKAIF